VTDEPGAAEDQQTQTTMSRPGPVRAIVASGQSAPDARPRSGAVPGDDRRWPPDVGTSHCHVRCGHLFACPIRA